LKAGVDEQQKDEGKQNATLSNHCCAEQVLLQTLRVYLEANGKTITVRALIDTGSQRLYILKKTAEEMVHKPGRLEFSIHISEGLCPRGKITSVMTYILAA
jgi:hypothetical protein